MAIPKSQTPGSLVSGAYLQASVDIASVAANSTLDVQVAAPKEFQYDRPIFVILDDAASALNTGLMVQSIARLVNNSGKKIEFRVANNTAGALDPTARTFHFIQI